MRFCSLSSCSYANSVIIQDEKTCILIDCGLRKRDIKPFLDRVGLTLACIDAVLITHCHADHVYGLKYFLRERNIPVYSTSRVLKQLAETYCFDEHPRFNAMGECTEEKINSMTVTPFRLSHDVETAGFIVASGGERLGFMTDTGFVPEICLAEFQSLDYLYIESNHDVEMYRHSQKPYYVKQRNLGPTGHLSNDQCAQALQVMGLEHCKLVTLAHLSEDDNEPGRALESAGRYLKSDTALVCAPSRVPGLWSDLLMQK